VMEDGRIAVLPNHDSESEGESSDEMELDDEDVNGAMGDDMDLALYE